MVRRRQTGLAMRGRRCASGAVCTAVAATIVASMVPPVTAVASAALSPAAAPPQVIRVGGPSDPSEPKFAVVGSSTNLTGAQFKVLDAQSRVVETATLAQAAGNASPFAFAEIADLSQIRTVGSYRVVVGALQSAPWVVRAGAGNPALSQMLNLFQANADGREPSSSHPPSHLNDATATVVGGPADGRRYDLTGGWMDAADYTKSTAGIAYSVLQLEEAAQLDLVDRQALQQTAAVGVRYLMKTHPAPGVFISQVGTADLDHQVVGGPDDHIRANVWPGFRRPELDDTRQVDVNGNPVSDLIRHRVAYATTASDVAGKAAAALAAAARFANGSTRTLLLSQAVDWYQLGKAHLNDPKPPPNADHILYSGDGQWIDDMGTGAAVLFEATGDPQYVTDALPYLSQSQLAAGPDMQDTDPYGEAELCGAFGGRSAPGNPADLSTPRGKICDLLGQAAGFAKARADATAFATSGEFQYGHLCRSTANAAIAFLGGSLGAGLAQGDGINAATGLTVAAGTRDYMFGRNPWGKNFLIGPGGVQNPQHWMESRTSGQPAGGLVGGPASADVFPGNGLPVPNGPFDSAQAGFVDDMMNYVNTEPSIECQSNGILLMALLSAHAFAQLPPVGLAAPYAYYDWGRPQAPLSVVHATGLHQFTVAFVTSDGTCTPKWNDTESLTSSASQQAIVDIRAAGAEVVVSFGGWSGNKLGETCSTAAALAGAYQTVIDAYHLRAIDIDVENTEMASPLARQRIVDALGTIRAQNQGLRIYVTMGASQDGPTAEGQDLISRAAHAGLAVDGWTIMPFDFGPPEDMGKASIKSAEGVKAALVAAYRESADSAYRSMGISSMNGHTDGDGSGTFETVTVNDFNTIVAYARLHHLARLAFWSINRDRSCSAGLDQSDCSGISQTPFAFTGLIAQYHG